MSVDKVESDAFHQNQQVSVKPIKFSFYLQNLQATLEQRVARFAAKEALQLLERLEGVVCHGMTFTP